MSVFDLTDLQAFAEDLMTATCRIERDAQGTDDDTFDQATGLLTPVADQELVYAGVCSVKFTDTLRQPSETEGGRDIQPARYEVAIPLSAPVPQRADIITIITADTDPALVGKRLYVETVTAGTLEIRRKLRAVDRW